MVVEGQVMDSMKWQSQPLPCEVSDIGHAVFDGADALMLGAATSIGLNPVKVSHLLCRIQKVTRTRRMPELIRLIWNDDLGSRLFVTAASYSWSSVMQRGHESTRG